MRKGLVYRSAAVSRGKVTGDEVIKGTLALWTECLNIKTLIDLRTNTEKRYCSVPLNTVGDIESWMLT